MTTGLETPGASLRKYSKSCKSLCNSGFFYRANGAEGRLKRLWRKACNTRVSRLPEPVTTVIPPAFRLALLILLGVSVVANMTAAMASAEEVDFRSCSIGSKTAALVGECASLDVPLDHSDPDGRKITLALARITSNKRGITQDPLTIIAGGPGQSAIDSFAAVAPAFRHILKDRDLILIDQRGTGSSHPLECDAAPDSAALDPDLDKVRNDASACHQKQAIDTRFFTTSVAVKDIEWVRKHLRIDQWNMYGISYGTRVALHYVRRYPDKVRTLILDAVVPPSIALGPDIAPLAQRSLDLIFARCRESDDCHARFPDIKSDTDKLFTALEAAPKLVTYEDIATGQLQQITFTRNHLAITLRLMSYNALTAALIPSMLHDAIVNDNFAPLARQADLQTRTLGDSLATGLHHAVVCTEDAPFMNDAAEIQAGETSYLGDGVVDALIASCESWPAGVIDDDFKEAVNSDIPTLVLSGSADPVTPPAYGDMVAKNLTRQVHVINEDQGHMQSPLGCIPQIMAQLVATASVENLSLDCVDRIHTPAFFVDANGPLP